MAGPAWMSKVSAGRAAGARGGRRARGRGGSVARGAAWRGVAWGQPALERGDDRGEGGARPCPRRLPPGPSPGPASGGRSAAGPAPRWRPGLRGPRGEAGVTSRAAGAGQGLVPWGAPRRFLPPPIPAPPIPAVPGLRPRLRPLRGTRRPAPWGSHRDPRRGKPAAPHLFWGGEPATGSVGAADSWDARAGRGSWAALANPRR